MTKTNSALTDLTARELLALHRSNREEMIAIPLPSRDLTKVEAWKQLCNTNNLITQELFDRAGICSKPSSHRYPATYPTREWLVDYIEQQQAA